MRLWSRPTEFVPSRFLPDKRGALERYQYIPFGLGPRVCIGQYFAMQEGVIALAALSPTTASLPLTVITKSNIDSAAAKAAMYVQTCGS